MKVLMTGATGLLGHYMTREFDGDELLTAGRGEENDIRCDLLVAGPELPPGYSPDLVVHAAGTEEEEDAVELNHEGTKRLLSALETHVPKAIVYLSSEQVYPPDSGQQTDENHNTWAATKAGQSKALAERELESWCDRRGVALTILRPSTMFGTGMKGWAHEMFNDVVAGRYVHIRGNEARLSCGLASDVARAVRLLAGIPGIFNLSDGVAYTYIDLADAMSANAGAMKRMTHLPQKWADVIYRFGFWIPLVKRLLDPERLDARSQTRVLSNKKATEAGLMFHAVGAVLKREDPDYPYETP